MIFRNFNFLFFLVSFYSLNTYAFLTELSLSYSQKKTFFNADNFTDTDSVSSSVSFYFMEKLAVELSYTDVNILREETIFNGSSLQQQTSLQKVNVIGTDLIIMLSDRQAMLQPYLKGGLAQIKKTLTTRNSEVLVNETDPINSISPSYGAGLKISLTESFGLKFSYDAWRTESKDSQGNKSTIEDSSLRVGVTWIL